MFTDPNIKEYLESWANELNARSNRVRQLIGNAHWLSDGHYKEAIIREFLRRHLPPSVTITRGFVKSVHGQRNCSPEIDILITDPCRHPPLFFENDLQIVSPSSVIAHLAVKTSFTKSNLLEDLNNIALTQLALSHSSQVWSGICFYEVPPTRDAISILSTVGDAIAESAMNIKDKHLDGVLGGRYATLCLLPTCITTLSAFTLFIRPNGNSSVTIRLFELGNVALACAFADLFSGIRRWFGQVSIGELDEVIECLNIPPPETINVTV